MLKGGILAWRSETSLAISNNKGLLSMVKLMEEDVPRSKLYALQLTDKKRDAERYQATIAAFDEKGTFLYVSSKKSAEKKLWLNEKQAKDLKRMIQDDYQTATGFNMTEKNLYIRELGLVYGGNTIQEVHNDDGTTDIPNFQERDGIVAESSTILYGIKADKDNRCRIYFAKNNERDSLKLVSVYNGMAVYFAGWVLHAGADHGGSGASTRLYVDIHVKKSKP